MKKARVGFRGRNLEIPVKEAGVFGKLRGLMFRTRKTCNLLFNFGASGRRAIHSCFVFFPFLALWLDKNNDIIEFKVVNPFRLHVLPKKEFKTLIELPINLKNRRIINFIVGKGKV
jgi:uncharacterized membrane protein (UPF0127 family)